MQIPPRSICNCFLLICEWRLRFVQKLKFNFRGIMVSFFINVLKLMRAIMVWFNNDQEFRILLFLLLTLLIGSTLFYSKFEGWSAIDALYFSVMTMSTIGYGDLVPTTVMSKIFTIICTFLSVGVFVSLNTKRVLVTITNKKEKLSKGNVKNK